MYNEFLFFYKKEPYKQFIWRYMGQISPQIREKSSLGHFCHHFLNILKSATIIQYTIKGRFMEVLHSGKPLLPEIGQGFADCL